MMIHYFLNDILGRCKTSSALFVVASLIAGIFTFIPRFKMENKPKPLNLLVDRLNSWTQVIKLVVWVSMACLATYILSNLVYFGIIGAYGLLFSIMLISFLPIFEITLGFVTPVGPFETNICWRAKKDLQRLEGVSISTPFEREGDGRIGNFLVNSRVVGSSVIKEALARQKDDKESTLLTGEYIIQIIKEQIRTYLRRR